MRYHIPSLKLRENEVKNVLPCLILMASLCGTIMKWNYYKILYYVTPYLAFFHAYKRYKREKHDHE